MTASRVRSGALIAALLLGALLIAVLPPARHLAWRTARHFGFVDTPRATPGRPLGSLALSDLAGAPVSISNRNGHVMVLNVFTTWCPSCKEEMPAFSAASKSLRAAGIEVIGIDQAESGPRVSGFLHEHGVSYPVYIDADQSTRTTLDARVIPTTVVVDRNNVVKYVHVGPLDVSELVAMARSAQ